MASSNSRGILHSKDMEDILPKVDTVSKDIHLNRGMGDTRLRVGMVGILLSRLGTDMVPLNQEDTGEGMRSSSRRRKEAWVWEGRRHWGSVEGWLAGPCWRMSLRIMMAVMAVAMTEGMEETMAGGISR